MSDIALIEAPEERADRGADRCLAELPASGGTQCSGRANSMFTRSRSLMPCTSRNTSSCSANRSASIVADRHPASTAVPPPMT
jgi:hypothetical protein